MFPVGLAVVGRKKTLKDNDGTERYNEKKKKFMWNEEEIKDISDKIIICETDSAILLGGRVGSMIPLVSLRSA